MFCQFLATPKLRGNVSATAVLGSNLGIPKVFKFKNISTEFWSAVPREKFCIEEWTAPPQKKSKDMIRPATWPFEQFYIFKNQSIVAIAFATVE